MRKTFTLLCLLLTISLSGIQAQTLTLLDTVQFPFINNFFGDVGTSDCWGWTDSLGVDYAIIGNYDNVAFVRASDGAVLDMVPAAEQNDAYYHRDMVTHGKYAYCVSEMTGVNEGLMIFDLSTLPDSVRFVGAWDNGGQMVQSHNIDIDEGTSHVYIEGDGNSGVDIVDITNPENPVKVGFLFVPGVHDVNARNDTLWVAEGSTPAYSVWDVTDKGNPVMLGRVQDNSFGYCHNIWPSDDGKFFITTEETPNKTIKIWDATNMGNIVKRGEYLATNNLAHNVHVMGDYVFVSHYTSGVTVIDWSDKDVPVEVAAYDTYPTNDIADFYGCWGAFPYTANGYVYASNFEGTLYILNWDAAVDVEVPADLSQQPAWPNPFDMSTNIPIKLDAAADLRVEVYDMKGSKVASLHSSTLEAGSYVIPWRPTSDVPSGTYVIRIDGGSATGVRKVEFIR